MAITTELGHPLPPGGPHSITFHLPGWDDGLKFCEGDKSLMQRVVYMYPRFAMWNEARELALRIQSKLALPPSHSLFPFVNPDIVAKARDHALSPERGDKRLEEADLSFRVVDVAAVRLYLVVFPLAKTPGIVGLWQNTGTGVSTRLAEHLLPHVDSLVEVSADPLPPPTWLPESGAHAKLRSRIANLLGRGVQSTVKSEDVSLHPTGMAAIWRTHQLATRWRPGPAVVLGSVFPATLLLLRDAADGCRHFGRCEAGGDALQQLEEFAAGEAAEGRRISCVAVEFPSNPILVSADLERLRQLADKYDFLVVVDDTLGSFCNVDVLPVADVVVSSLTKSFSGYADVMGGSLVLNPAARHYAELQASLAAAPWRNALFAGDADKLLANSADYLARSAVLNRNARAVAELLKRRAASDDSVIAAVLYPTELDSRPHYEARMRQTADFAAGYGGVLAVELRDKATTRRLYDALARHVFQSPTVGAHRTIVLPFGEMMWGRDPREGPYHAAYGVRGEQIRISVGLEDEQQLVDAFAGALTEVEGDA